MLYKLSSKRFAIVAAAALLGLVAQPLPAQAAGPTSVPITCSGMTVGSGAVQTCQRGGGGTYADPMIDTSWTPVFSQAQSLATPGYGPCTSTDGLPSYLTPLYQARTNTTIDGPQGIYPHPCLAQLAPAQAQVTQAQAKATLKVPVPTADFTGNFLTGAPVAFTVDQQAGERVPVPGFAGAYINATPVSFSWNFGDSSTGTSSCSPTIATCSVQHVYQSTMPNSTDPTNHTVSVTVTGSWHIYVHQPAADAVNAVQDLGTVTLTGTLNPNPRTIVQVWSAQTEPTN
jgi:hypothetical protein